MSNPQKAKGAAFERLVRDYLAEAFPCERIPAGATLDRGDLWTPTACIQCKNHRTLSLGSWLTQTAEQQRNAGKPFGVLVCKRKGTTDPADQFAILPLSQLRSLLSHLPP
jgi:hypothetical protein